MILSDKKAPLQFTETAGKELKRLMQQPEFEKGKKLRIGVKGGGCSGMSYILGFDELRENDNIYEIEGIPVIINKAHEIYLAGMQINWEDGLNNRGFSFTNPNASSTCGCGTSFAV